MFLNFGRHCERRGGGGTCLSFGSEGMVRGRLGARGSAMLRPTGRGGRVDDNLSFFCTTNMLEGIFFGRQAGLSRYVTENLLEIQCLKSTFPEKGITKIRSCLIALHSMAC